MSYRYKDPGDCIGRLNALVTIKTPTVSRSATGDVTHTYATLSTAWAEITAKAADERENGEKIEGRITHELRMRYLSTLATDMRIVYGSQTFEIRGVRSDRRRAWHTVLVEEVASLAEAAFTNTYSIDFDGANDHLLVSPAATIDDLASSGFSISVWVKPRSDGEGNFGRILQKGPGTGTRGYAFYVWGESGSNVSLAFLGSFTGQYGAWYVTDAFAIDAWSHVVLTWDGTATAPVIYINGVSATVELTQAPAGSYIPDTGSDSLYIGTRATADRTFDGRIDEPALFNYELTSGQVTSVYNSAAATDLSDVAGVIAPVWWLRCGDDDDDSTAAGGYQQDQISTNHGAATNMTAGDTVEDSHVS